MARKTESNGNHDWNSWVPSWARRIVPAGYATATLTLTGTSMLLMHNGEVDDDSKLYRAYYLLGQKKKKTLDEQSRLREMEWQLGIYLDGEIGPYIPGKNVHELLRESATAWKKGAEVTRSLVMLDYRIPLGYDGPRTQAELWDAPNEDPHTHRRRQFAFTVMVANSGASRGRVRRCRPCFPGWSLVAPFAYDPEALDFDLLGLVAERSQRFGLGDYRPTFGSFTATLEAAELHKNGAAGDAAKPRNKDEESAHGAFKDRVMVGEEG